MLGFDAIAENAISDTATTVAGAGKIAGEAFVAGEIKFTGIFPSAGKITGQAIISGATFTSGIQTPGANNQLFDFSVNALAGLLWQADIDPVLTKLIKSKQAWLDLNFTTFWETWFTDVFDLRTANFFGCCVWSIILECPINIQYPETDGANWGFGPYQQNFDNGNFAPLNYEVIPLSVQEARAVLQLRYFQLTTGGNVPNINQNLARIFAPLGGTIYAIDNLNMTMDYVATFVMSDTLQFILNLYNLLPSPAGVATTLWQNGQANGNIVDAATVVGATAHVAGKITGSASVLGVGRAI